MNTRAHMSMVKHAKYHDNVCISQDEAVIYTKFSAVISGTESESVTWWDMILQLF